MTQTHQRFDPSVLWPQIQGWAQELGLSQIGVSGIDLGQAEAGLQAWLAQGFHASMDYMARHGSLRARPAELVPGTVSVITARMDYLPSLPSLPSRPGSALAANGPHARWPDTSPEASPDTSPEISLETSPDTFTHDWQRHELARLQQPQQAVVSLYARGRDYHKVLRTRLQRLAERIAQAVGPFGHRVFTDSAPVLEVELASRSGLGWRGKHTLLLSRQAGSMFFLGELFVDFALPPTPATSAHCGQCSACLQACPTQAIVAPYRLDARRCISYLTIEHDGPIPLALRPLIGNRIYGCDDCQLVCPWNKYAQRHPLPDWQAREGLSDASIVQLLGWSEAEFLRRTEGSAIRRIGHERWLRNLALAAGNALASQAMPSTKAGKAAKAAKAGKAAKVAKAIEAIDLRQALARWQTHPSETVREQIAWSLAQGLPPRA